MIAKRIIPCLDIDNGRVVKGVNFVDIIDAGDPVELAKAYDEQNADELVFLDITASSDRRDTVLDLVERVANQVFIPFTVGGGIRTVEDMRAILLAGAEKIAINTAAVNTPQLIKEGAFKFGSQCIVLAIDARRLIHRKWSSFSIHGEGKEDIKYKLDTSLDGCRLDDDSIYEVVVHGGRTRTGLDAVKWAKFAEDMGAGEVLLTSMDADGTKDGYDLPLCKAIKDIVSIPVIASGGAGNVEHIKDALEVTDAALLASLLHYGELTVGDIKDHLKKNDITVRK